MLWIFLYDFVHKLQHLWRVSLVCFAASDPDLPNVEMIMLGSLASVPCSHVNDSALTITSAVLHQLELKASGG